MRKVLIYEPSRSFARFLTLILSKLGYEVFHVDRSDEVLSEIAARRPDLIISESSVPGLSGIDLVTRLRSEGWGPSIPVAIVSIDGTAETRQEALEAGCVDYLTKPLTARAVHELMERHLPFHYKRHNLRSRMRAAARIRCGSESLLMETLTIGEGGMYACTPDPLPVGTVVAIELTLPGLKSSLELKGEVIYGVHGDDLELPPGIGVKFLGMDSNTVVLLRHYMESFLSDYIPCLPPEG